MFGLIVAYLLKTIISVFIGMEPSVLSALCIVNIDILLSYLYILRVSVQSIVHLLNVHIYHVSLNLPFVSYRSANWKYVFQIITSCSKIEPSDFFIHFEFPVSVSVASLPISNFQFRKIGKWKKLKKWKNCHSFRISFPFQSHLFLPISTKN